MEFCVWEVSLCWILVYWSVFKVTSLRRTILPKSSETIATWSRLIFASAYDAITLNAMEAHHIGYRPIFAADNIDTHPNSFYQIDQIILEDTKSNIHRFMQNSYSKLLFTQLRLLNKFGEANPMNRIPVPTDLFEMFYTDNQNDLNNNLFIPQNQNY